MQPTNFSVTIRQAGRDSLLDVSGSLTSYETGALRETISRLLKQGRKNIVLNLGALQYWTFRDRRARQDLCLDGESEWPDESGRLVAESGRNSKDYSALSGFPEFPSEEAALQSFPESGRKETI